LTVATYLEHIGRVAALQIKIEQQLALADREHPMRESTAAQMPMQRRAPLEGIARAYVLPESAQILPINGGYAGG
jgi:hypothetical protein